jgi:DNA-binding MarR family transcriptional regulator
MAKLVKYKIKKSTKWSSVNLTVLEDPNLSPKAKWIHTYLMTRPPDWEIRTKDIINRSTAGRDSIYNGLKELVDNGYIHRERVYKNGRIIHWSYEVYEEPLPEKLVTAKPEQENLVLANQDQENPDNYLITPSNRKHIKIVSNETIIGSDEPLVEKPLLLRINPRNKNNNNGLLFNSSVPKKFKKIPLNHWNKHPLDKTSKYDRPVIALQSSLMRIKRPMGRETQEVIDHWNESASQLSNNGHKLPTHRLDLDTKTSYMCKLIVTGILHTSSLTVEDIKKAIDNYTKVLQNSTYYHHLYTFPQFYSKPIFSHCVEGNLNTYIKYKKELKGADLLEEVIRYYRRVKGHEPRRVDVRLYDWWIQEGRIKDEDDIRRVIGG